MKVRFVTGNPGKAREAALHLSRVGVEVEAVSATVPEIQADTLEEVARAKAESLRGKVATPFFAEDAGIFIQALQGFPGVYSAYVHKTIGNEGVLRLLEGQADRAATFRAVVAFVDGPGPARLFSGEAVGEIASAARGKNGFGYDPVFVPSGDHRTFAQLTDAEKTATSHRARALDGLAAHLGKRR